MTEPNVSVEQGGRERAGGARAVRFGLAALLLFGAALLLAAAPASADTCEANTHEGCDGHDCEDTELNPGPHNHKTVHKWWWDHWCKSAPSGGNTRCASATDAALCIGGGGGGGEIEGPLNGLDPPLLDDFLVLADVRRFELVA